MSKLNTKFNELTVEDALAYIPARNAIWLKANHAFYNGDHWQGGAGWSGPMVDSGNTLYNETLSRVKAAFVSRNVIREVLERHTGGVVGRAPSWSLTVRRDLEDDELPDAAEQALIKEGEALLRDWWGRQQALAPRSGEIEGVKRCTPLEALSDAVMMSLYASRSVFRLFVPESELSETEDGVVVSEADLPSSMRRIYLRLHDAASAAVGVDTDSMRSLGVYVYQDNGERRAELCYLDDDQTVIRLASDDESTLPGVRLALGKRLTFYEMQRPALITASIRQEQKALNKAQTMGSLNTDQGGFLERIFLNAQMPGRLEDDPSVPGGKRFVPEPFHVGPGTTNYVVGVETVKADGSREVSPPSVVYRDPVSSETFQVTSHDLYRSIVEEVHQAHVLMSNAAISGESRIQAKADFALSLLKTRNEVEPALRWLLETVLALAAAFSGRPGYFDSLRASVEVHVDTGPLSGEESRLLVDLVEKQLLSRRTGIAKLGVDDIEAELKQIEAEIDETAASQGDSGEIP